MGGPNVSVTVSRRTATGCSDIALCTSGGGDHCEVNRLSKVLSIPEAASSEGRRVCQMVVQGRILKRQPLSLVAAASLYAACREERIPVTLTEFAGQNGLKADEVGRCYRRIVEQALITPPAPNGTRYVDKVARMAGVAEESRKLSQEVERGAIEAGFENGNPMVVAAASVYLACLMSGENRTQADIAAAAGVGVISLRECAKKIRKLMLLGEEPDPLPRHADHAPK